jgi:alkylation response protein AidB-like acyl-CoA dehydrogenase
MVLAFYQNFRAELPEAPYDHSLIKGQEARMPEAERHSDLPEVARLLGRRITTERERIETARRLPEDLARDLANAGFFRMSVPADYGGLDLSPAAALEVLEELARTDASLAWCVWNGNSHWIIARLAETAARDIHADADVITANSTRASGTAVAVPGGYQVSGRWSLVSGCQLAAWMVLLCKVHDGIRFMIIPAAECEIIDTWTVGGLRGTGSHDVVARDVFVPAQYSAGFTDPLVLPGIRYRLPPFSRVIPGLGAIALGVARTAIETFAEIAGAKTPAEALVCSARMFLFDSVERQWTTLLATGEATMPGRARVRLAASHAVASAVQAVDLLYLGAGASSLYTACPLERAFRDVHAMSLHIGVHPRVMETTGRVLFGLEPDTPLL